MKVRELKEILAQYSDDTEVAITIKNSIPGSPFTIKTSERSYQLTHATDVETRWSKFLNLETKI